MTAARSFLTDFQILELFLNSETANKNAETESLFAFIYNAIGIPIAVGLLYLFFGMLLSPMIAGAAMSLSSVSVISNALRLRKARL